MPDLKLEEVEEILIALKTTKELMESAESGDPVSIIMKAVEIYNDEPRWNALVKAQEMIKTNKENKS